MTRIGAGETIVVPPTSNIYTVMIIAATVAVALGLLVIFMAAGSQVGGLLGP